MDNFSIATGDFQSFTSPCRATGAPDCHAGTVTETGEGHLHAIEGAREIPPQRPWASMRIAHDPVVTKTMMSPARSCCNSILLPSSEFAQMLISLRPAIRTCSTVLLDRTAEQRMIYRPRAVTSSVDAPLQMVGVRFGALAPAGLTTLELLDLELDRAVRDATAAGQPG